MDLSTSYMGLALRNPLVASASPLSYTLDGVRRLADAGVGAIVLFSLFEEQLREEAARTARLVDGPADSFPEALDYVPAIAKEDAGPRRYLSLLERAAAAVDVPVIASLNGVTPGGWTDYARAMQDAGAAAIELNIYYLPGDPAHRRPRRRAAPPRCPGSASRPRSPCRWRSSSARTSARSASMALRTRRGRRRRRSCCSTASCSRTSTPKTLALSSTVALSSTADGRLPRTWIALLRGRVRAALAATGGVEGPADVAKLPARRRGRRDDRLGAVAARSGATRAPARRAVDLDGAQGLHSPSTNCAACSPCRPAPTRRRTTARATSRALRSANAGSVPWEPRGSGDLGR